MGGLVANSATGSDRTSAIGWMSAAASVPMAEVGDELRPHHAPAQARMTPPSLRNVLESLVPIMNSLLSQSRDRSLFLYVGQAARIPLLALRACMGTLFIQARRASEGIRFADRKNRSNPEINE
jgi:hypothetical protein